MMNLKEKILEVCKKFAKDFDAKLWRLGTNIYSSVFLLIKNIQKNFTPNELNLLTTLKIEYCGEKLTKFAKQNQLQGRYKIVLNDKNVTPINDREYAAQGTIRQYFQELIAINFVNGSQEHFNIKNNTSFDILPPLKSCIFEKNIEENITKQFINLIIDKGYSKDSQKFEKNLAYSLFLSLLLMYDETKQITSKINIEYLKSITSRSKINHASSSSKIIEELADYRNQFCEICSKIKKYIGDFPNFESKILDKMISDNEKIDDQNRRIKKIIQDGKKEIENARCELKPNICQDRNYSEDDNSRYSDFDNYNGKLIKNYHPCHIFPIKQIKNAFQDEILELYKEEVTNKIKYEEILSKYKNYAKNSSNGLLMLSMAHHWYDQNAFGFDFINGKIWIKIDYENVVAEAWGLDINQVKNLKIKNNILNDEMKTFLKLRAKK